MTKKIPWYEMKASKIQYIETPLTKFVGGTDKIIWPWFLVVLWIFSFLGFMFIR